MNVIPLSARRIVYALIFLGVVGLEFRAAATDVTSLMLGSAGTFHPAATLHGTYAFTQIRITFDTEVFVDFYDLHLSSMGPRSYSIPLSGFSYDHVTHTAIWQVDGQPAQQNERFQAVLAGVWDSSGIPLSGGGYTNSFSVLTGDVSGDDHVSPIDLLIITNHINAGTPYDPVLDINLDGVISPSDMLIVINMLNAAAGSSISLIAPGSYRAVLNDPAAALRVAGVGVQGSIITLKFSGLPAGSRCKVEGKDMLSATKWYAVLDRFATQGMDRVSFPRSLTAPSECYRASFR